MRLHALPLTVFIIILIKEYVQPNIISKVQAQLSVAVWFNITCLWAYFRQKEKFSAETLHILSHIWMTLATLPWKRNKNRFGHFRENRHVVFWCPSEWPLFVKLQFSYSPNTDLWRTNSRMPYLTKIQLTVQELARCACIRTYRHKDGIPKTTFFVFGREEGVLNVYKLIRISRSILSWSRNFLICTSLLIWESKSQWICLHISTNNVEPSEQIPASAKMTFTMVFKKTKMWFAPSISS
jgi:hypothetical protein